MVAGEVVVSNVVSDRITCFRQVDVVLIDTGDVIWMVKMVKSKVP